MSEVSVSVGVDEESDVRIEIGGDFGEECRMRLKIGPWGNCHWLYFRYMTAGVAMDFCDRMEAAIAKFRASAPKTVRCHIDPPNKPTFAGVGS